MAQKPVFFDASGRRSARLTLAGWIAGIFSVIIAAAFVASLAVVPRLSDVNMPVRLTALHTPNLENKAAAPRLLRQAATLAIEVRERQDKLARNRIAQNAQLGQASLASSQKPLSIAFYASWSPDSFDALKRAL